MWVSRLCLDKEGHCMKRVITSLTVALTFACAIAIQAQDTTIKSETKVKAADTGYPGIPTSGLPRATPRITG